ncbi:MAG TPA: glucokinase [Candidatus Saccharimonadales bacterium]|nr:glucokinase [Candidatus Saccharimonadales bacterium]
MILAGDVGGTKCNLALFSEKDGKLTPVFKQRFASKEFAQFDRIVREFARQASPHIAADPVTAAGFGIAGPVLNNTVRATNLPWTVDGASLAKELNVEHIVLLNDLGATGHSIEHLPPEEFCVLNVGKAEPGGTRALLAAGTGLGQSFLVWNGSRYQVVPSEGGHSDFAPHSEEQIELLRFMRRRYPQVSWELILSGRGFRTLHEFLSSTIKHASFEDPDADPAPEITRRALEKSCPVCVATLNLWMAIYGAEAGNLALKVLSLGGVYVAGGIAVKVLEKMKDGTFIQAFKDKWKFEGLMSNIPVSVILNENAPLLGAAYEALALVRK